MKGEGKNSSGEYKGWCEVCGYVERLSGLRDSMSYGECPNCHEIAFNDDFIIDPEGTVHIEDEVLL